ncbi:S8 family serine peptidase [Pontibacter vulgaris]|uniref:S8 family serine peptidase n=1 Tax=Pontibacter vulgaris TaxID=2905679 RepID=UPI001FA7BA50|nr:hypothetical protein [Pontibacter vulgaris]
MKILLPLLGSIFALCILTACDHDSASPIRNVRFDPKLLNQLQDGSNTACTNYTYNYGGKAKYLGAVNTRQIIVAFDENLSFADQQDLLANFGFVKGLGNATATSSAKLFTVELESGLSCRQVEQAIKVLQQSQGIRYAAPFFQDGAQMLGISNELLVTLKQSDDLKQLRSLLAASNAAIVMPLDELTYLVRVDKNSAGNALELANSLQNEQTVAHAEPDFILSSGDLKTSGTQRRNAVVIE